MNQVIRGGDLILDYPLIGDPHGVLPHGIQDMVADNALRAAGFSEGALGYRTLLGTIHDQSATLPRFTQQNIPDDFSAGSALWLGTYDTMGGIAQPEILWGKAIRDGVLKVPPGFL
jgi:hypothetical protein